MYTYKWNLVQNGFIELDWHFYSQEELKKSAYVEQYLSPSVKHALCGWDHCIYHVFANGYNDREEFVALYPDEDETCGRFINVSGNSLGAIAEALWNNIFN